MLKTLPADKAEMRAYTLACVAHGPGAGGCCHHHLCQGQVEGDTDHDHDDLPQPVVLPAMVGTYLTGGQQRVPAPPHLHPGPDPDWSLSALLLSHHERMSRVMPHMSNKCTTRSVRHYYHTSEYQLRFNNVYYLLRRLKTINKPPAQLI